MAAYKSFLITYTMADGDVLATRVKAPKYPTRLGMLKADANVGVDQIRGEGDGFKLESWTTHIGSGEPTGRRVVWYVPGKPDQLLYSYTVTLEVSDA